MSTWTNVTDTVLEPGQPIRSVDIIAIKNNIIAVPGGAANAPRVQTAAIQDLAVTTAKIANANVTSAKLATGNNERDWVLARTAGASVGAVGTYAWLGTTPGNTSVTAGGTKAGSGLRYAVMGANNFWNNTSLATSTAGGNGGTPAGTWRAMGGSPADIIPATLWLRIS
jgi:hypothetical protein